MAWMSNAGTGAWSLVGGAGYKNKLVEQEWMRSEGLKEHSFRDAQHMDFTRKQPPTPLNPRPRNVSTLKYYWMFILLLFPLLIFIIDVTFLIMLAKTNLTYVMGSPALVRVDRGYFRRAAYYHVYRGGHDYTFFKYIFAATFIAEVVFLAWAFFVAYRALLSDKIVTVYMNRIARQLKSCNNYRAYALMESIHVKPIDSAAHTVALRCSEWHWYLFVYPLQIATCLFVVIIACMNDRVVPTRISNGLIRASQCHTGGYFWLVVILVFKVWIPLCQLIAFLGCLFVYPFIVYLLHGKCKLCFSMHNYLRLEFIRGTHYLIRGEPQPFAQQDTAMLVNPPLQQQQQQYVTTKSVPIVPVAPAVDPYAPVTTIYESEQVPLTMNSASGYAASNYNQATATSDLANVAQRFAVRQKSATPDQYDDDESQQSGGNRREVTTETTRTHQVTQKEPRSSYRRDDRSPRGY